MWTEQQNRNEYYTNRSQQRSDALRISVTVQCIDHTRKGMPILHGSHREEEEESAQKASDNQPTDQWTTEFHRHRQEVSIQNTNRSM
jgi:hypothetical protein